MDVVGPLARVTFNRPAQRNGVVLATFIEMHEVLTRISAMAAVDVVVLTGAGSTFCPGADLRNSTRRLEDDAPRLPEDHLYHSATLLHEMPQLTVAAINGACAGAGLAWAVSCDLRLAAEGARFATSLLEIGFAGELGLAWNLQRIVGAGLARDLLFLPRKLESAEALRLGLVSRVFPSDSFDDDVEVVLAELLGRDRHALRAMKRNLVDAARFDLSEYVDVETVRHRQSFDGARGAAAIRSLKAQANRIGVSRAAHN